MASFLQFMLALYIVIGFACCWWGIKCIRGMDIKDQETLMLLFILALASITLWPLFCVMEGVTFDNPFTRAMSQALQNSVRIFQEYTSRKAA
jgi:hypothetical protein